MKTILFLHAGAELYGADRILLNLVTELNPHEFHPIVVLPTRGPLVDELRQRHIEVHIIDYPILRRKYFNPRGMLRYLKQYRHSCRQIFALLKQQNVSIIHANTLAVLEGIYLKRLLRAKLVWHVHEIITCPRIAFLVTSFAVGRFANQIVAVSKEVRDHLVSSKLVNPRKIRVVYNGVDTEKFRPMPVSANLRAEFQVHTDAIVIGMVGRINAWKGQTTLLQAMIPLLKSNPKLKLIFIGGVFAGEEKRKQDLETAIAGSQVANQIVLKDFRNDLPSVYHLFDVFVLPSTNPDPLPTVVLEAMAAGKPIVGFRQGGVIEMVQEGLNGFLATPIDVGELTQCIQKLVDSADLRSRMGAASRARAIRCYSPQKFIRAFEDIYNQQ
ncbi:glycosyltransferase family 4 protein [Levilactobacillus fujinensis]|uniref:Glycosyltransferase family 4 protein n=1 Tax=Levilactobacillus fujinensis TaxID=2486024 RepID=A0ABW1TFC2_9LACO|nr:glycosyltransferase family 4 protein [Levilactobacillus fujinensis]